MTKTICSMCNEEKNCSYEPTRSALTFGGFPVRYEYRCASCEREVCKSIDKMFKFICDNFGKVK